MSQIYNYSHESFYITSQKMAPPARFVKSQTKSITVRIVWMRGLILLMIMCGWFNTYMLNGNWRETILRNAMFKNSTRHRYRLRYIQLQHGLNVLVISILFSLYTCVHSIAIHWNELIRITIIVDPSVVLQCNRPLATRPMAVSSEHRKDGHLGYVCERLQARAR